MGVGDAGRGVEVFVGAPGVYVDGNGRAVGVSDGVTIGTGKNINGGTLTNVRGGVAVAVALKKKLGGAAVGAAVGAGAHAASAKTIAARTNNLAFIFSSWRKTLSKKRFSFSFFYEHILRAGRREKTSPLSARKIAHPLHETNSFVLLSKS